MASNQDEEPTLVSETDNFVVWKTREDEETVYHLALGSITLHLASDEWDELVLLIKSAG